MTKEKKEIKNIDVRFLSELPPEIRNGIIFFFYCLSECFYLKCMGTG